MRTKREQVFAGRLITDPERLWIVEPWQRGRADRQAGRSGELGACLNLTAPVGDDL
jgi:hypothetical protein